MTTFRDPKTVPGTEEWVEANAKFTRNMLRGVEGDCSLVADKLPHFREWCARHGADWEAFCGERLLIKAGFLEKIEEGVRILRAGGHSGPISRREAEAAHARELAAATEVTPLPKAGGTRPRSGRRKESSTQEDDNQGSATTLKKERGAEYLVRRLKRDAPEIAQRLAEGAFPSARAAAKAAGIIKTVSPMDRAKGLIRNMSEADVYAFKAWFRDYLKERAQQAATGATSGPKSSSGSKDERDQ